MSKKFEIEAIGQVLRRGAQEYECVAIRPSTKRDGTPSRFAVLKSQCADCKADFECTSAMSGAVFQPNRRCDKHKAAGVPIGPRSKKDVSAALAAEVKSLKEANAELRERLVASEKRQKDFSRRLARYELSDDENRRFAERCEQATKERRALLARAKNRSVSKSVFD